MWTYVKEMYHYDSLWKTEQKVIFDLGNLVNEIYTGIFNTTLTAKFFTAVDTPEIADVILPISAQRSFRGQGSAFSVPSQPAIIVHEFPLNIEKAVVSLAACGQDQEEFWYISVLSSRTETFGDEAGSLKKYSPFREIQLLIDGKLASVAWLFPVIFTNGIVPGLWRSIVGIDAFDLREHEIDITPFVPLLCDGNPHVFQIQMMGLKEDGVDHAVLSEKVASSWVVSGKIFFFLNKSGHRITGFASTHSMTSPYVVISSRVTTSSQGANKTLVWNTEVNHHVYINNLIATPNGYRESWWRQKLFYFNFNKLSDEGRVQFTSQSTTGFDESKSDYQTHYTYPLTIYSAYSVDEKHVQIDAGLSRGLDFTDVGPSVFPLGYRAMNRSSSPHIPKFSGGLLSTTQSGHASYFSGENDSYSFGTTQQDFFYQGMEAEKSEFLDEIYHRHPYAKISASARCWGEGLGKRRQSNQVWFRNRMGWCRCQHGVQENFARNGVGNWMGSGIGCLLVFNHIGHACSSCIAQSCSSGLCHIKHECKGRFLGMQHLELPCLPGLSLPVVACHCMTKTNAQIKIEFRLRRPQKSHLLARNCG